MGPTPESVLAMQKLLKNGSSMGTTSGAVNKTQPKMSMGRW